MIQYRALLVSLTCLALCTAALSQPAEPATSNAPAVKAPPTKAPAPKIPAALPASTATIPGAPPPIEGGFTIMVLPDTQFYSQKFPDIFHKQTQWVADNLQRYNVPFVLQLGDITETAADAEWEVAKAAFARLDGKVPYILTPGNHDYGGRLQTVAKRSPLSNFFPVSHFAQMRTFGGVYDAQPDKSDNSFHTFEAGGRKWLVIAFEFAPRNDVLRWAGEVCDRHPDHSVIIVTHAYLDPKKNERFGATGGFGLPAAKPTSAKVGPNGTNATNGTAAPVAPPPAPLEQVDMNLGVGIWDKLASKHANMAMVLSGHACYTNHKSDKGVAGNVVQEVVVDYQSDVNGGNGWMRLLQFLPDGRTVRVRDYSPVLDLTCTMADRSYDMDFPPLTPRS